RPTAQTQQLACVADRRKPHHLGRAERNDIHASRRSWHDQPRRISKSPESTGRGQRMTAYEAKVVRDGKWWMVSIPSINGLTQARRLSEATQMTREYIAASQDVPLETVSVTLKYA